MMEKQLEIIIEDLKDVARAGWPGEIGESRAEELEKYLKVKLKEYADALGTSELEVLEALENKRSYSAVNYYQEANQPSIKDKNVRVFEGKKDLMQAIGNGGFRCPSCNGITKNPYECESGVLLGNKTCNWKVYGLLSDLGKGAYIFLKEEMVGERIFMPVAWEG